MNLYPHQLEAKSFLLEKGRCILASEPRTGKTLPTASAALDHLPALIVCPAVVKAVWAKAFATLDPSKSIRIISGKKDSESVGGADIVIINYDLLGSIKMLGKFNTLILDECHRIKNPKAIRTKATLKLMARIGRVYALSGTVIPNRSCEIFPLLKGLGIYRGSWHDYIYRYCKAWSAPWGLDYSGNSNASELRELIEPFALKHTKAQVFQGYQAPVVSLITFDLPIDKREKEFDADALIAHPSPILAFEGLAEIMREAGLRKVKPTIEFIEDKLESEQNIVILAHHKLVVAELAEGLKKYGVSVLTGDTKPSDRELAISDFGTKNRVFIGNIQSVSEGIDLSIADTLVFAECSWSTSALEQGSARIENITKNGKAPLIYLLTIHKSLDHVVLAKVLKKQNIINQII